jgi:hypothetical protein
VTLGTGTEALPAQVKLKVPQQVARIIKDAGMEEQLRAARGEVTLSARDLLTTLFFLAHGGQPEIRSAALSTVRRLDSAPLQQILVDAELHPRLVDFLARTRGADPALAAAIVAHPALPTATLQHLAAQAPPAIRRMLGSDQALLTRHPQLRAWLAASAGPEEAEAATEEEPPLPRGEDSPEEVKEAAAAEEGGQEDEEGEAEEDINLSKYQQALEMGVSAKIKMALTGDKEWRAIFLKDSNKLVSSAVMKNPRISDGEVLAVAKSKTASEDLIRLITLNPDWIKRVEIQKALVVHPRTPLPKALRFMSVLTEKDLKVLAKSRGVSATIVNSARRMLQAKLQKK